MYMKKIVAIYLFTNLLACSSVQQVKSTNDPLMIDDTLFQQGVSEIRLIREHALLQMMADVNLQLDGEYIGSIANKKTLIKQLTPGEHMLTSDMGGLDFSSDCDFKFMVELGEVKYISLEPSKAGILPILSILTNPLFCKFNLTEESYQNGKKKFDQIAL